MSVDSVQCTVCRDVILQSEIESGRVTRILRKPYCGTCTDRIRAQASGVETPIQRFWGMFLQVLRGRRR